MPATNYNLILEMEGTPTVSVVTAAYNVADYVAAAVESVLAQTLPDFEMIIVDDGSTDGTLEILRRYRDPRIRLVECSHRGMPHPLMDAIELARAPYLAFLDADDFWSPLKLERHVHFFQQHPEVDLTFSWSRFVDEHGRDTGLTSRMCRGAISFSELLADNVIGNGSTLVVRREAFLEAGGIDPSMPTCYDVEFCLRMALLRPGNLCAIPELLTSYRRRPGQLTGNIPLMEQGFEHMIEKMRALEPSQVGSKHRQSRSNMRRFFAFRSFQEGRYAESLRRLGRSFREAPAEFLTDKRNWQMIAAAASGLLLPSSWHGYLLRATLRTTRA